MSLFRYLVVAALLASLAGIRVSKAADDASTDTLKAKDLVKSGNTYVLSVEQEVADGVKNLRKLKVKLDTEARGRRALEDKLKMVKNAISSWDHMRRQAFEAYLKINDVTQKNAKVAEVNVLDSKLTEANGIREDLEKQLNGLGAQERQQFIDQVLDLAAKLDKAQDTYKDLSDDPDVKQAIEKMNAPGKPKMKLGPSTEFVANINALKKWRGDVSSDTIQIKNDNNVPVVEVTLNGTVVREMVVDSGASIVCLTADLAKQLNMNPTDKDPTLHFKMADGKEVDAKQMILKSVRVGQFTVTDVECAVLPATLVAAEPLLGGSFLNNFIFKVDPKAGEMHLAVIVGNSKVTTAGGVAKDTKKKTSGAKTE